MFRCSTSLKLVQTVSERIPPPPLLNDLPPPHLPPRFLHLHLDLSSGVLAVVESEDHVGYVQDSVESEGEEDEEGGEGF